MKNKLTDLRDHLFELIETMKDSDLEGDKLDQEIKRSLAINELSKTVITSNALMIKAVDSLYGLPVSDELAIIPQSPAETPKFLSGDRKALIDEPKGKK